MYSKTAIIYTFALNLSCMFSKKELKRYNRHIIMPEIGLKGQEKLKNAKVLVIGAGGLGCPVLQYLAAAGVGTLGVCDFDYVDESNLQRQILFADTDIGKPKARAAAEKLRLQNPYISIIEHNFKLDKSNAIALFQKYDIIIDGSDNFPTRFLVNDTCVIAGKPLVFGAIYKFEGQVSVFNYQNGPTYRCLIPEQPDSSEMLSCSQIGVIGVLPGIIGSYQASEAIKIITGVGEPLSGKILLVDTLAASHNTIEFKRNEKTANITELADYGDFCTDEFPDVKQLTANELKRKIKNKEQITIIDIREADLFKNNHIAESINYQIEEILNKPELVPKNTDVLIVCENGNNSLALIDFLEEAHRYKKVYNLKSGFQAWQ
jgi:adenylyltransferase/sulfurtransferase